MKPMALAKRTSYRNKITSIWIPQKIHHDALVKNLKYVLKDELQWVFPVTVSYRTCTTTRILR
jgi:hypothetical protein